MAIGFQWTSEGSIGNGEALSAPAAVSKGRGELDVFVVGPDNQVWTKWWNTQSRRWSDWGFLGGQWTTSSPAVVSKAAGQMDLFIVGDDTNVYTRYYNPQQGWNASWAAIGDGYRFQESPGVSATSPGAAELVALDRNLQVGYKLIRPGSASKWNFLQDGSRVLGAPAATSEAIFVARTDGHVEYSPAPWLQAIKWTDVGGNLISQPAVVSVANVVFIFGQQADGLWFNASLDGVWQGWERLGDAMQSAPSVVSKDAGQVDIFFKGPDGLLWCKSGLY